ncbi:MAG: hypothetical protein IPM38_00650 [Ignavibacteria bacterium]|nr:hypothetical protein [Ignavibacteria bacterium]
MKKFLFIFLLIFICSDSYSQTELVNVSNPVYDFLKRMQLKQVIPEYNSSAAPLSRKKISSYLLIIKNKENLLTGTDRKILNDLSIEFEYDMYGSVRSQSSLFKKNGFENIFNDRKEKYLYFYSDSGNTFYSKFNISFSQRGSSGDSLGKNSITLGQFGLDLRGTLFNAVAYSLNLNRGAILYGDSADISFASKTDNDLKGNYSFSKDMKNFNSFEGYLRFQTGSEWMSLMFGRSKFISGYGYVDKLFLSQYSYPFDFGKIEINYKALSYSFTYGSIQGDSAEIFPKVSGVPLSSKNIASHSLNINFSDAFKLGLWETVIISQQPFSFTYLNPVSFLTSADLGTGDEQTTKNNSLLGIEFEVIPVKNISFQSSLLIDDLTFGTLGKNDSLNENKYAWQFGAYWTTPLNADLIFEYTHLDPFVYSHRSNKSTYTNKGVPLGHSLPPNSDEIAAQLKYRFSNRLGFNLKYRFQRSGEGILLDSAGNLIANYGGDINFGLGDAYLRSNGFLDGKRINRNILSAEIYWEPVNQFALECKLENETITDVENNISRSDFYFFTNMKMSF